jgi:formylglycine-generating enzyme required for sulfatase activity
MAMADLAPKLKVFISYSRRDSSDFSDELVAGLELAGFAPFLDRHDIAPGENWEMRLSGLIEQADTVVYVVSPEAIKSERCKWEVDRTLALSKRLVPVIYKQVSDGELPGQLSRLQFIRFDIGPGITRPLAELAGALRQDLEWIREHTRLGELATRWQTRNRPTALLLQGDELAEAKEWEAGRRAEAPQITDLQRALLEASGKAEAARLAQSKAAWNLKRRLYALVGVLVLAIAASLIGWLNEAFLREQWHWLMSKRPYMMAQVRPHVLIAENERYLKPGDTFIECVGEKNCPLMTVIPEGQFTMGSPADEKDRIGHEGPQHNVVFAKPFAVSRFEVTFEQWETCVAYGDCNPNISDGGFGRGRRPVVDVAWEDARRYVAWLATMSGKPYRLLSEAEWEYAARAGTQTPYPWGNAVGEGHAKCSGCGRKEDRDQPDPVGSFASNAFGLSDMNGNVREWVEDCFHSSYRGAPTDGSAWTSNADCKTDQSEGMSGVFLSGLRVVRGGAWAYPPEMLRSASRVGRTSGSKDLLLGFRVGRTLLR